MSTPGPNVLLCPLWGPADGTTKRCRVSPGLTRHLLSIGLRIIPAFDQLAAAGFFFLDRKTEVKRRLGQISR